MNSSCDVVITGIGVVSPIGIGADQFWQSLVSGNSGVGLRHRFEQIDTPHRIAAAVRDFEPKEYVKPRKALKIMCRPIQFGCAAAMMAVEQANVDLTQTDSDRLGTVFGTETFFADPAEVADVFRKCTVDSDYQHQRWGEFAMREIQPLWMLKYLPNMAASHISIALDARGPSNSICQGEASGLLALIEAADLIRRGACDLVVAGGTGSQMALTATLYRGTEMLSKRIDAPEQASRPFDQQRDGMVVGEGAGAIVLESAEHATARGANVLARLTGWSRGYHDPATAGFADTLGYHINRAIESSEISGAEIDVVNANGNGSIAGDALEASAIAETLGDVSVVAHKSNFGNLGPGTSCVELIAGIQSIQHNVLPATINCQQIAEDCPINVNTQLREYTDQARLNHVLKSSYSSTGQLAAVVLGRK